MWLNEELSNGRFPTADDFASKAKAKGYGWMTLELNDHGNETRAGAVRAACEAHELVFTIWLTRGFTAAQARQWCIETGAEGFIAEAEIPAEDAPGVPKPEAQNWAELTFELADLGIPCAVATNFAPFTYHDGTPWREKAKPLIDAGWACLSECYLSESPNSTPANQDFFARHFGWTETQPILGLYGGSKLEDYGDLSGYRNVSHWDAGTVL